MEANILGWVCSWFKDIFGFFSNIKQQSILLKRNQIYLWINYILSPRYWFPFLKEKYMGRDMLWLVTLEDNFCKVFIRMEGQWLIALYCSQYELFTFSCIQSPCVLFVRQKLRPYLLDGIFFVNSTYKVENIKGWTRRIIWWWADSDLERTVVQKYSPHNIPLLDSFLECW